MLAPPILEVISIGFEEAAATAAAAGAKASDVGTNSTSLVSLVQFCTDCPLQFPVKSGGTTELFISVTLEVDASELFETAAAAADTLEEAFKCFGRRYSL